MTNETEKNTRKPRYRRSFFGPILLIAIGLIFLGKNIGLIPAEGWGTIWRLWPVLLIVAGVDDLFRREGVAWPVLMIGAGIFLLFNYFGPQTEISWTQILQLWPILLIALGIDVLFKGQSSWMSLVGVLLAIALIGGAVWLTGQGVEVAASYDQILESRPEGIVSAELDLSLDVGELIISDDGEKDFLIAGSVTPPDVQKDLALRGSHVIYELENIGLDFFPYTARWELDLNPDLPADLLVNNAVGELILEIGDLELESLWANQGVGRMVVQLPGMSAEPLLIKQGIGVMRVVLPEDSSIAIDAQQGLSKVDFPAGFELEDGYYVTPGATRTNADLLITVEQGVGLVDFQYAR